MVQLLHTQTHTMYTHTRTHTHAHTNEKYVELIIRPCLNITWDLKFFNLNQNNCCCTLQGNYLLTYILAQCLHKVLAQNNLLDCYPLILHSNLFYYVKLICETPHENCQFINPLLSGKGKSKFKKPAEKLYLDINQYADIAKFIIESVKIEMEQALSTSNLILADVKRVQSST